MGQNVVATAEPIQKIRSMIWIIFGMIITIVLRIEGQLNNKSTEKLW